MGLEVPVSGTSQSRKRSSSLLGPSTSISTSSGSTVKSTQQDLYQMIAGRTVHKLRSDFENQVSEEDPITYHGSRPFYAYSAAEDLFRTAPLIEVVKPKPRRRSGAALLGTSDGTVPSALDREQQAISLKLVKVGLLSRKGMSDPRMA